MGSSQMAVPDVETLGNGNEHRFRPAVRLAEPLQVLLQRPGSASVDGPGQVVELASPIGPSRLRLCESDDPDTVWARDSSGMPDGGEVDLPKVESQEDTTASFGESLALEVGD